MAVPAPVARELALDLIQLCLDLAGIVDPTPVSDTSSMLLSIGRGRFLDAVISGVSLVPWVGDLAKLGKFQRYLETVRSAIRLAGQSTEAARVLAPVLDRLRRVVDLLPRNLPEPLARMRDELRNFRAANAAAHVANALPDIRRHFRFRPRWRQGSFEFEEIAGRLGVPGRVQTFGSRSATTAVSRGTGEHAGHRIGERFGAPTDHTNLSLQNPNMNSYAPRAHQEALQGSGGSYLRMEDEWARQLQQGYGIEVVVRDKYRIGETRPIGRFVEWIEIAPNGTRTRHNRVFGNFNSPQAPNAAQRR
jgi:hypothetical protein